ncbi:hypothetical protein PG985_002938 [Apiospora marii]|uniref:uncharacterized protein n=1 Tax=Apiospora marii TaxID=335849 RepID=UPI00312EA40D
MEILVNAHNESMLQSEKYTANDYVLYFWYYNKSMMEVLPSEILWFLNQGTVNSFANCDFYNTDNQKYNGPCSVPEKYLWASSPTDWGIDWSLNFTYTDVDGFWSAFYNATGLVKACVNLIDVYQQYRPAPACGLTKCQYYRHWPRNAPWPFPNFTLPNPKDAFVNPADSTTDNMGGVEETCFAALMDLVFNQMDADFDPILLTYWPR